MDEILTIIICITQCDDILDLDISVSTYKMILLFNYFQFTCTFQIIIVHEHFVWGSGTSSYKEYFMVSSH